ncbi:MAG: hypothetical protein J7494_06285 [Sphingobium sp.]|nr:hypothetical protein [Sphingobium sp.]
MLAAYADGELGPEDAAKVEAAMAADPALAEQVAAHRKLRDTLSAHFAPIAQMPVPERLTDMLGHKDNVVSLAAVRQEREAEKQRRVQPTRWAMGGAIAASLVMGVMIGGSFPSSDPIRSSGDRLVAAGALDRALTTQLASVQQNKDVHIFLSFQTNDGHYCRGFESGKTAGIACRESNHWAIVRSQSDIAAPSSADYRQAGSGAAQIMAAAQDMATGGALDEAAEKRARDADWLRRP